jgi:hypothetical protein
MRTASPDWKKVSNGKVIVNIYPGGVVGDDPDIVRKMRSGTLHAGVLTTVGVAEIDKSVHALGVPMMYGSYEEVYTVFEKMRPALEANIAKQGFVVLNWADGGWVHFFSQRPVATPDDLKKLKKEGETDVKVMKDRGLNVVPVDARALDAWVKLAESAYPRIRGQIVPAGAFDEALKYRDEYRKRAGTAK